MMNSIIIAVVAALIIVLLLVVLLLFAKAKLTTSGEVTIDINDGFDRRIASCDACCPEYLSAVRLRRTGYLRNVQVPGIGGRR